MQIRARTQQQNAEMTETTGGQERKKRKGAGNKDHPCNRCAARNCRTRASCCCRGSCCCCGRYSRHSLTDKASLRKRANCFVHRSMRRTNNSGSFDNHFRKNIEKTASKSRRCEQRNREREGGNLNQSCPFRCSPLLSLFLFFCLLFSAHLELAPSSSRCEFALVHAE